MTTLIYIHGFLSSPESHKAQITQRWLCEHHPEIDYRCPSLSPYPDETKQQLLTLMNSLEGQSVGLIGSSLGGFWSTWLIEQFAIKGVLINPSVRPFEFVADLVGEEIQNYYSSDTYCMQPEHAEQLRACYQSQLSLASYRVLVQTGDETLDYRQAVERYKGASVSVEDGGDHGFQDYERHLPSIIEFLFS